MITNEQRERERDGDRGSKVGDGMVEMLSSNGDAVQRNE
jgi:hypothetical protein